MNRQLSNAFCVVSLTIASATAQSLEELRSAYSGAFQWDESSATVRFTESGSVDFSDAGPLSFIWKIPSEVKQVNIAKGVTVNAAFHSQASVTIKGEDRKTSIVYGTNEQAWSKKRNIKAFTICTFQNFGGVMTLSNLTSLDPRGFHVRGWDNVVHVAACDFLDKRDGHGNNSDGFEGGDGSTVHDCYFESGDDIIKSEDTMTLRGEITNAYIKLKHYAGKFQKGTNLLTVYGTKEPKPIYECGGLSK